MTPIYSANHYSLHRQHLYKPHWQLKIAISACMSTDMLKCLIQSEGSQS
jgi:hypothetical protein